MATSIRLPDEVLAAMHQLAVEHDRTLNSEIIQACKAWMQAEREKAMRATAERRKENNNVRSTRRKVHQV